MILYFITIIPMTQFLFVKYRKIFTLQESYQPLNKDKSKQKQLIQVQKRHFLVPRVDRVYR